MGDELALLPQLEELNLQRNALSQLPLALGQLTLLTSLNLGCNGLTSLCFGIRLLTRLRFLSLNQNALTTVDEIVELTELRELDVSENKIPILPTGLERLTNIKSLRIHSNLLSHLPDTVSQLSDLEELFACRNQFMGLPSSIGGLRKLERLDFQENASLLTIPVSITGLTSLRYITFYDAPHFQIPNSIPLIRFLLQPSLKHNSYSVSQTTPWSIVAIDHTQFNLKRLFKAEDVDSMSKVFHAHLKQTRKWVRTMVELNCRPLLHFTPLYQQRLNDEKRTPSSLWYLLPPYILAELIELCISHGEKEDIVEPKLPGLSSHYAVQFFNDMEKSKLSRAKLELYQNAAISYLSGNNFK